MKYDDIINLPHFHAKNKPYMSLSERAAQFMPFKSLNGYHELIDEDEKEVFSEVWEDMELNEDSFLE